MNIPEGFQFSQSSLQDFVDCRFRFFLRYLGGIAWPALQSEPAKDNEHFQQLGRRFHQLVQGYFSGVPEKDLADTLHDSELTGWWANFLDHTPALLEKIELTGRFSELSLSAALQGTRLVAKLDFLGRYPDGRLLILDWKTNRRPPRRQWLQERLQTRLYPYLLVRAGSGFNAGQDLAPEQVGMTYWFPSFPDQPEHFSYTDQQYDQDETYLSELLSSIKKLDQAGFTKTYRLETCQYCVYRSLCDRGEQAGAMEHLDSDYPNDTDLNIDFDQIAEIDF